MKKKRVSVYNIAKGKSSGAKIRKKNPDNAADKGQQSVHMSSEEYDKHNSGTGNSHLSGDPWPSYNLADCEVAYQRGNSFIILGRDRPRGEMSGYGGRVGVGNCASIDLIAGMTGIMCREVKTKAGNIVEQVVTDKNPQLDAARIYISQRSDIDDTEEGFDLAKGTIGQIKAKSAIAIKADSIRIIARDGGIKIVTGPDIYDSNGLPIRVTAGINLIAGNNDTTLQPMVKGENLVDCLLEMVDRIDEVGKTVEIISKWVFDIQKTFATHYHSPAPPPAPPGTTLPSLEALTSLLGTDILKVTTSAMAFAWNAEAMKNDMLSPAGGEKKYILSFKNHAN
jgi:hypothetical protein